MQDPQGEKRAKTMATMNAVDCPDAAPKPAAAPVASFAPLPPLPAGRTWRLGSTSYVYPADVLPNVERLAGQVEDIELVLFESDDVSNLPDATTIDHLANLAARHDFTYTVHLPIDRDLGSPDPAERRACVAQAQRIFDLVAPLRPAAYLLHLQGVVADAPPARVARWQADTAQALDELLAGGIAPQLLCVENLQFPFAWCEPLVARFELSVCIDTGHLWLTGADAVAHARRHLPRTRVVHLHGERDGRDHLSLAATDPDRLAAFVRTLADYRGVVTLEVFSRDETASSITCLREILPCPNC